MSYPLTIIKECSFGSGLRFERNNLLSYMHAQDTACELVHAVTVETAQTGGEIIISGTVSVQKSQSERRSILPAEANVSLVYAKSVDELCTTSSSPALSA